MSDIGETTFHFKDAVMLVGGIISLAGSYFTLKYGQKATDKEVVHLKEEIMAAKSGRHALKKEICGDLDKREDVIMRRIDKTQNEHKEFAAKTDNEFKDIILNIGQVKMDTSEIKGMVQTLLSQKTK